MIYVLKCFYKGGGHSSLSICIVVIQCWNVLKCYANDNDQFVFDFEFFYGWS